jgi:hypothetical protein
MSIKTVIIQVEKSKVKPEKRPDLIKNVREIVQDFLFKLMREGNDAIALSIEQGTQEAIDLFKRFPDMKYWSNPSDEKLRELVQEPENNYNGVGGYRYTITDEADYVNGIVKIYSKGHQAKTPSNSVFTWPEIPGFRYSEEVRND